MQFLYSTFPVFIKESSHGRPLTMRKDYKILEKKKSGEYFYAFLGDELMTSSLNELGSDFRSQK